MNEKGIITTFVILFKMRKISLLILLFIFYPATLLISQESDVVLRSYTTKRLKHTPPVIDGVINETAWDIVPWEGGFIQRSP